MEILSPVQNGDIYAALPLVGVQISVIAEQLHETLLMPKLSRTGPLQIVKAKVRSFCDFFLAIYTTMLKLI